MINVLHAYILTMSIYDQCLTCLYSDHVHIWSMSCMSMFWPCPYMINVLHVYILTMSIYDQCLACLYSDHVHIWSMSYMSIFWPCPYMINVLHAYILTMSIYDQCLTCLYSDHVHIWSMSYMSIFWPCPYMINVLHVYILTMSIYDQCLTCLCSDHLHVQYGLMYCMQVLSISPWNVNNWPLGYTLSLRWLTSINGHKGVTHVSHPPLLCGVRHTDLVVSWRNSAVQQTVLFLPWFMFNKELYEIDLRLQPHVWSTRAFPVNRSDVKDSDPTLQSFREICKSSEWEHTKLLSSCPCTRCVIQPPLSNDT